jgi:tetratricopeptide (TPR) repeat protein
MVALLLAVAPESEAIAQEQSAAQTSARLRAEAIDLAYNLDHDRAIALLRQAVELTPDSSAAHRNLASILWLNMLFRRGAVTVDHYLGAFTRTNVDLAKPPPELDAEFRAHVDQAVALAEKEVAAAPKSASAHYDLGAALGLQVSYIATVEGKLLAAFKRARRCFDEHERVLQLDPSMTDAGLIVGTYRYLVSNLSLPMRLMAYAAGFGGGRDRAIALLEATASGRAAGHTDAGTDAMFALILVYNREKRYDDALRVMDRLRGYYPRNRLVLLEQGATALRAGRATQADALLTEGITRLSSDSRPKIPGEAALWHYKRGAARAELGQTSAALADLAMATGGDAQAWVNGRARIVVGQIALKRGDRGSAAAEAQRAIALCRTGNDPACVDSAGKLLRDANGR